MSREWKESNAAWQTSHVEPWEGELEENITAQLYEQSDPSTDLDLSSALDLASPREPFFSRFEALQQFGQQISPIVIPLVFGGMTFLFILSLFRTHFSYLHSNLLWPIALFLIALAVLQGMVLYYAGANNVFWLLGVITGFFLFMLVGCFVIFGPWPTGILLAVLIILAIVAGRFYMRPVPEGTVDIVYAFSKYTRTLYPGLNFVLPWEWVDTRLQTREQQWTCPEQAIQVSRTEDIHLKATISYQLMPEDAHLAIVQVDNWEENLHDLFTATLQDVCGKLQPEDFMAWLERPRQNSNLFLRSYEDEDTSRWEPINNGVFQRMRDRVALWGVLINWVQVRDITLTPHASVNSGSTASAQPSMSAKSQPQAPTATKQAAAEVRDSAKRATPPPQPASAEPAAPAQPVTPPASAPAAGKLLKEEILITAYNQIKSGKVRSPETIRSIASQFLTIANDPEASKNVSFDASRAAQVLVSRAELYEKERAAEVVYQDEEVLDVHESPTQSDWLYPAPSDENIKRGG